MIPHAIKVFCQRTDTANRIEALCGTVGRNLAQGTLKAGFQTLTLTESSLGSTVVEPVDFPGPRNIRLSNLNFVSSPLPNDTKVSFIQLHSRDSALQAEAERRQAQVRSMSIGQVLESTGACLKVPACQVAQGWKAAMGGFGGAQSCAGAG